ncbi:MAG: hypothetical protein OEM94_05650 [Acidimicrobiia bacterium]|nr:hypothetical protein [Acidimicrobiia bacterium]
MALAHWSPDEPVSLADSIDRFRRWGDDGANRVVDGAFYRVCAGGAYRAVQGDDGRVTVESDDADACLDDLRHRLGGQLPIEPIKQLVGADEFFGRLWRRLGGYRPPIEPDPVESLVTSVTAQQVNLAWATTTRRRLVELLGTQHLVGDVEVWAFPTAEALAGADPLRLRELQFTTAKSRYIVNIATAAAEGRLAELSTATNAEVIERLTQIKGVGRWTADWFLARSLGRPDAVAAGDLGVRKAIGLIYLGGDALSSEEEVRSVTAPWGDAANWATHLLLEELA